MPVKSLEAYLFERGLASTFPIEILKNARLGIDVNHYVSRLVTYKRETFIDATGGFPQSLKLYIESDLQIFKEFNITPIFVFGGNDIADQYALSNGKEQSVAAKTRDLSWSKYSSLVSSNQHSLLPVPALVSFRDSNTPYSPDPIISELLEFLVEKNLEYIRAPYLSWVQLSYLYEKDFVDAIYGPTETLLLGGVDKFILGLEVQTREIRYVDKLKVLNEFGINPSQLLDIAVSVGCDLQPLTLPIYQGYPPASLFDVGLEIVATGGSIYHSILSLNIDAITERFQKGVLALQFMPVLKTNGRVELSNFDEQNAASDTKQQPPTDVHDIIGQRLPHEYYFYESIGLIQPKILESIVFGTYVEKSPIDGVATTQFRNTVNKVIDFFKNKEINLLTQNMARYYQMKKIHYVKRFDGTEVELENRMNPPLYYKISSLVTRSTQEKFNLVDFLKSLTSENLIGENATRLDDEDDVKRLRSDYEVVATSFLRFLYLTGFFDYKEGGAIIQNGWTKALLKITELDDSFNIEQYVLLLIFLKLNSFNLQENLSANLIGGPKTKDQAQRDIVQLISRLALFINSEQSKQTYLGPLSRSLLNVRSSVELVKDNTRELFDSILINSLSNNEVSKVSRSNKQWKDLVVQVPFAKTTPSTILSIILQTFLDFHYGGNNLKYSKSTVLDHFRTPGITLKDTPAEFSRGFHFVREAFKLVEVLNEDKLVNESLYQTFVKADKLSEEVLSL